MVSLKMLHRNKSLSYKLQSKLHKVTKVILIAPLINAVKNVLTSLHYSTCVDDTSWPKVKHCSETKSEYTEDRVLFWDFYFGELH